MPNYDEQIKQFLAMKAGLSSPQSVEELQAQQDLASQNRDEASRYAGLMNVAQAWNPNAGKNPAGEWLKGQVESANQSPIDVMNRQKAELSASDAVKQHLLQGLGVQQKEKEMTLEEKARQARLLQDKAKLAQDEKKYAHQVNMDELKMNLEDSKLRQERELALAKNEASALEKGKKSKESLAEVENRKNNINNNLDKAIAMIKDKGTYETVGPHNAILNGIMGEIATDMAKLQDPNSVARPGEVEQVLKNLVSSGVFQKNSTAVKVLEDFKNRVGQRAAEAYHVRGLEEPSPGVPASTDSHPNDARIAELKKLLGK